MECPTCHHTRRSAFSPTERAILAEIIAVLRALFEADDRAHSRRRTIYELTTSGATP